MDFFLWETKMCFGKSELSAPGTKVEAESSHQCRQLGTSLQNLQRPRISFVQLTKFANTNSPLLKDSLQFLLPFKQEI